MIVLYVLMSLGAAAIHLALLWPEGPGIAVLTAPLSGSIGMALYDAWVCFQQNRPSEASAAYDTLISTPS